jgi:hypothetical protein
MLTMAMDPRAEAAYALDHGVGRQHLKPEVRAEYDQLVAEGYLEERTRVQREHRADTIGHGGTYLRFDDEGITIRNWFRTYRIGWAEVRRFTDGSVGGDGSAGDRGGKWVLAVSLHTGRTVIASSTKAWNVAPSKTLVAVGLAAERYGIPADLTGTIERGSFPATLLGTSATIRVTIRDDRLALDGRDPILEVTECTEPVQPRDILTLSHDGTDVEVLAIRQIFAAGRWEQVAHVGDIGWWHAHWDSNPPAFTDP